MNQKIIISAIAASFFTFAGFYNLLYFDYVGGVVFLMVALSNVFFTFYFYFEEKKKRK